MPSPTRPCSRKDTHDEHSYALNGHYMWNYRCPGRKKTTNPKQT